MPGDICVLGSDGLFDNVSEEELLEEVRLRSTIAPVV
jgi:serine/threonine protein phosphatase PrpC